MNHCYRLVWNDLSQGHVPAPECARSKGRTSGSAGKPCLAPLALLLAGALSNPAFAAPPAANALPTGGQVVAGQAGVAQSGSAMTVTQGSDKAILNWQTFDIGSQASVRFIQPSTSAVALNRVLSGEASQIYGKLSANGHVFLVNPAGVVFGAGSKVDVGGLVASTMDITNEDFLAGRLDFRRNGASGGISNQGEITAGDGGLVALLAPTVRNEGIVSARLGNVVLAAGDRVTLQAGAGGLLQVQLDPATVRTLVENKQLIVANGGQVLMTGKAADILSASVVANTGTVQANTLQEKDGRILLLADMQHGETRAAGTLQAKFVETSAATVNIDKNLKVDTGGGQWLIDPVNITIDQNKATAIAAALGSGNVTVSTSNGHTNPGENTANTGSDAGDIHIDAGISYSTNTLTLHADNDIHINAAITATNGGLTLQAGNTISATASVDVGRFTLQSGHWRQIAAMLPGFRAADFRLNYGSSFVRATGGDGSGASPYALTDVYGLQGISTQLGQSFTLAGDIDASSTLGWNGGAGFIPIGDHRTGDDASRFTGSFNGNGHTISNLTVKVSSPSYELFGNRYTYAGLFGVTGAGAWIRQVGLVNANISATGSSLNLAGGLVAQNGGSIVGVHVSGSVSAWGGSDNYVGALVGLSRGFGNISSVADSDASANVSASDGNKNRAGGLVGLNYGDITQSHASGNASASGGSDNYAGALAGANFGDGRIIRSHASGNASASHGGNTNYAGALVGHNNLDATIVNSYASGNANALGGSSSHAGGLAGVNSGGGSGGTGRIFNSYAMGNATASGASIENYAGGLVGTDWGSISQSYASGSASASGGASSSAGGLVGRHSGTGSITNAFYATADASGNAINNGGESSGGWSGNGHGVGKTRAQLMDSAIFSGWDTGIWSFGDGANVEGYEVGLPSLISVTRAQDLVRSSLFNGGWGTAANPYGITDWQQLSNIRNVLAASYSLSNNLDSTTAGYTQLAAATANGGAGFAPIGDNRSSSDASRFTGSFDGQGHTISDLNVKVSSPSGSSTLTYAGLFGVAGTGAQRRRIGLVNAGVSASGGNSNLAGALVGYNLGGSISDSYAGGSVSASGSDGSNNHAGGLVGINTSGGSISNSYATGSASALSDGPSTNYAGGLAGINHGRIANSYATGNAVAAGGHDSINYAGGLASRNNNGGPDGRISDSYASGSAVATGGNDSSNHAGGLIGLNNDSADGSITRAFYATTDANGNAINNGGNAGTGWSGNANGVGKTLTELKQATTFVAWGTAIDSQGGGSALWRIYDGHTTPLLRSWLKAITVTASGSDKTYDGTAATGTATYHTDVAGAVLDGNLSYATTSKNAGTYRVTDSSLTMGGLYSGQQGYDIRYDTSATLTISKANLTVSTGDVSKTYDGTAAANGTATVTGGQLFGGDTLSGGSFTFADKNAGNGKSVTVSNVTVEDGNGGGNYAISYIANTNSRIDKANLTISTGNVSKSYDGTTAANGTATVADGRLFGGDSLSGGSFAFADKNAGSGKTVTVLGVTVQDGNGGGNYNVSYADNTGSTIDKATLTVSANSTRKTPGDTLIFQGTEFTTGSGQLKNGETVTNVMLVSDGAPASAQTGSYRIEASDVQGENGFVVGNYDITYVNGTLTVAVATGSGGSMANPGMPSGGSLAQALRSHVAAPEEKAKRTQRQAMGADQAPSPQQLVSASPYLTMTPGYIRIRGQVDEE